MRPGQRPDFVSICFTLLCLQHLCSNDAWRDDPCEPVDFLIGPCMHLWVLTTCIFPSRAHIHARILWYFISKVLLTCVLRINIVPVLRYLIAHPSGMEQLENETQTSKDVNGGTAPGNGILSAEPRHQDQELSRGIAERGHRWSHDQLWTMLSMCICSAYALFILF